MSLKEERAAQAFIEGVNLEEFYEKFPKAADEILDLAPIKTKELRVQDELLLEVSRIVTFGKRRKENDKSAVEAIRAGEAARQNVSQCLDGLFKLDPEQFQGALTIIGALCPKLPIPKSDPASGLFRLLETFHGLMAPITLALRYATDHLVDEPKRGRPSSRFVRPAYELMWAWESATAVRLNDSDVWVMKRIPVPKRLTNPSTVFIGIALRLIDPQIKDSEIITAIKHALKWQQQLLHISEKGLTDDLLRPETLIGLQQALAQGKKKGGRVRK